MSFSTESMGMPLVERSILSQYADTLLVQTTTQKDDPFTELDILFDESTEDYPSKIAKIKSLIATKVAEMSSQHNAYMKNLADKDQRLKKDLELALQENEEHRCKGKKNFNQRYLVSSRLELMSCRFSFWLRRLQECTSKLGVFMLKSPELSVPTASSNPKPAKTGTQQLINPDHG